MSDCIFPNVRRTILPALFLSGALAACGGGGSSGTPTPPAPVSVQLAAVERQTLAGGKPLTLSASASDHSSIAWTLDSGSPGTLSATSGASVSYIPPASVGANTVVRVKAGSGAASQSLALTVFPDPGTPGLSIISGRLNPDLLDPATDGPVAAARFRTSLTAASDLNGNVYVAGTCMLRQTMYNGLTLRKIGTDGQVSTLASCETNTWFGAPDSSSQAQQVQPSGLAVDRNGNMYFANFSFAPGAGSSGPWARSVLKLTPQGALSLLAGSGTDAAAIKDGTGANARFLTPAVAGIDGDDNLYVLDQNGAVVRKITPSGDVSTVAALPASVNADLNGNTYRVDNASGDIIATSPTGTQSTIANLRTLPGVTATMQPAATSLVRTGPASFVLVVSNRYVFSNEAMVRLVVRH